MEAILASFRTPRDARLTAEPDGQDLDLIIGELQSRWGVPQYPQEYRITIKVAEERPEKVERSNGNGNGNGNATPAEPRRGPSGAVRERAPAAPRVAAAGGDDAIEERPKPRKRRRRGRRRRPGGDDAAADS